MTADININYFAILLWKFEKIIECRLLYFNLNSQLNHLSYTLHYTKIQRSVMMSGYPLLSAFICYDTIHMSNLSYSLFI